MAQCDAIQQGKLWNNSNFLTRGICTLVRTCACIAVSVEMYYEIVRITGHIEAAIIKIENELFLLEEHKHTY